MWLRNLHDPILPFVGVRSGPDQYERFNDLGQGCPLLDEEDARALAIRFQEVTEVTRHRPEIGSDKNPILTRGEGQYFGVGNSFQPSLVRRKKIDCRLTAETPGDDRIVETGIRQEADYPSTSPRGGLLPDALKRRFDLGRRWMGSGERILLVLAFRNVPFHLCGTSQIRR